MGILSSLPGYRLRVWHALPLAKNRKQEIECRRSICCRCRLRTTNIMRSSVASSGQSRAGASQSRNFIFLRRDLLAHSDLESNNAIQFDGGRDS